MTRSSAIPAVALAAAAWLLYAVRLEHTPAYLYNAEILFGLQAQSIATTAHDLSGRLLPLYFQMRPIGENVWFHPVIVYVTALFLKPLPFGEWSVRLPSAFVGAANVVLLYYLARRLFARRRDAVLAAGLLLLTPAHFIHSRIAMDYIYPIPFVLAWLIALAAYLERNRLGLLFASTSILGIGVYSYIASVVMMPVYLAFTLATLWWTGRASRRTVLVAAAGFAWPLALIPVWLWFHPTVITETLGRYRLGSAPAVASPPQASSVAGALERLRRTLSFSDMTGRLSLYWYFFDPAYLFVTGGYANVVNSTRHAGVFALPLLLLVPAGLVRMATARRSVLDVLVVACFFAAPIAACLAVPEPYAIDRELTLVPFGVLLAVYGVQHLRQSRHPRLAQLATAAVVLAAVHFLFFSYDYFTDYRRHSAIWFELNHRGALEELVARDNAERVPAIYLPTDADPYMDAFWQFTLTKLGRKDLRDRTVFYAARDFNPASVPPRSLVLMRRSSPLESLVKSGGLRLLAVVPEIGDPPEFFVLQR